MDRTQCRKGGHTDDAKELLHDSLRRPAATKRHSCGGDGHRAAGQAYLREQGSRHRRPCTA